MRIRVTKNTGANQNQQEKKYIVISQKIISVTLRNNWCSSLRVKEENNQKR